MKTILKTSIKRLSKPWSNPTRRTNIMINITIIMESYASPWSPDISPKEYINPIHRRRGNIMGSP